MTKPQADGEILAIGRWRTNGELIADCARLGYLRPELRTLDPTYGMGVFWSVWRPVVLVRHDLDPAKAPDGVADATALPYSDRSWDQVVIDPPYKLNGTGTYNADERYGVFETVPWHQRMALISAMLREGSRVLGAGCLLLKCQDQVCCGKKRWQTMEFAAEAATLGLGLVDRFDRLGHRPQPGGRRQVTSRSNSSTLLVFKRGWETTYRTCAAQQSLFGDQP